MKRIFTTFIYLCVLSVMVSNGQAIEENEAVKQYLNSVFENIDKTRVPTGLLKDYAVELVELSDYSGSSLDSVESVDAGTFGMILRTIRSSAFGTKPFGYVDQVLNNLSDSDATIPVAIALYEYSYIKESALEDGLITFTNDKVYDVYSSGVWQNPYEQSKVFAFAPMKNVQTTGGSVTFDFDLLLTNQNITLLQFDAGDGSGFRTVSSGTTIDVSYLPGDDYILSLKATLSDGSVLWAKSGISVTSALTINSLVFSDDEFYQELLIDGDKVSAYVTVKYKPGNTRISTPFIIAEGFDSVKLLQTLNSDYGKYGATSFDNIYGSIPDEMMNNFDFIYVDWNNSESDLFHNAELLKKIIRWVNQQKSLSGSAEKNIVVGQSMGGLISRIALRQMELSGEQHDTQMYVSHDSPHLGANIPIGALFALNDLYTYWDDNFISSIESVKGAANVVFETLYSKAAQQMLVNYVNESGVIDATVHESFMTSLNALGFPQGYAGCNIRNIAIANSSKSISYDNSDMLLSFSGDVLNGGWAYIAYQLLGVNPLRLFGGFGTKLDLSADLQIRPAIGPNYIISSLYINYYKTIFGVNKKFTILAGQHTSENWDYFYDAYPGSYYGIYLDNSWIDAIPFEGLNTQLTDFMEDLYITDKFMFIPTASALCIKNGEDLSVADYTRDYSFSSPIYPNETPFSAVLVSNESNIQPHLFSGQQLENHMTWISSNLDMALSGPSSPVTGDQYFILNKGNRTVTWTTSDSTIATINQNGIITVKTPGFVTIYAYVQDNGSTLTFEKQVMTGFPSFTLNATNMSLVGAENAVWRIRLTNIPADFADYVQSTNVKYHWGVRFSGQSQIEWRDPSTVIAISVDFEDSPSSSGANVYFYASNNTGVSAMYSTSIENEVLARPIIVVDGSGNIVPMLEESTENADVKSMEYYSITIDNTSVYLDFMHYPTYDELMESLVGNEDFSAMLKQMMPWGEEDLMVKIMTMKDSGGDVVWEAPLTIIYKETMEVQ